MAVLPVVFFHAGLESFSGGFVGVDVFFVISGYLITAIILDEHRQGKFTFAGFYERRARRILPALFVVLLFSLPLAYLYLSPSELKAFASSVIATVTMTSNFLFWWESGYFDTASELKPLLHTWSLAVEEQFYLFFPPLLLGCLALRRAGMYLLYALFAGSFGLACWAAVNKPELSFYLIPTRAWELLIGAFLALSLTRRQETGFLAGATNVNMLRDFAGALGLVLVLVSVFWFDSETPWPGIHAMLPTIGTALIIVFADQKNLSGRLLGCRPLVGIGLVSYSAYLWHQPLLVFARQRQLEPLAPEQISMIVVLTFLFAYLTWLLVETPVRNRSRFSRAAIFRSSALVSVVFILVGLSGISTEGFIQRYSLADREIIKPKEEHSDYVWSRVRPRRLQDFSDSGKPKILMIGDSLSGDVLNAMHEAGISSQLDISSYFVFASCGNLYLEEDFIDLVEPMRRKVCREKNWYQNDKLFKLIRQADEVWLISRWKTWTIDRLQKSIDNLKRDFDAKIIVFGDKFINDFKPSAMLGVETKQGPGFTMPLAGMIVKKNFIPSDQIAADGFVASSSFFCDEEHQCKVFTEDGFLIFFDGLHLTAEGARYWGKKMRDDPMFNRFLR